MTFGVLIGWAAFSAAPGHVRQSKEVCFRRFQQISYPASMAAEMAARMIRQCAG
jgi:hypothetical protein